MGGVTEVMSSPPLASHSSWIPPDGDANRMTPSGDDPDPVMPLRTMMPALPYPVRLVVDTTLVSIVAVLAAAPGR